MRTRRFLTATAVAAVAATAAFPTVASADPEVWTNLGDVPSEGHVGETSFDILASGCVNPGGDAYFGGWVEDPANPNGEWNGHQELTPDGTFSMPISLGPDSQLGTFEMHLFCAQGEVTSETDPDILWASGTYTFTINAARSRGARAATATTSPMRIDPDALPVVDKVGIRGSTAAQYKRHVDNQLGDIGKVTNLYKSFFARVGDGAGVAYWTERLEAGVSIDRIAEQFGGSSEFVRTFGHLSDAEFVDEVYQRALGRPASDADREYWVGELATISRVRVLTRIGVSLESTAFSANETYVIAAYQALGRTAPSAEALELHSGRLDSGTVPRVQVVEDIALELGKS